MINACLVLEVIITILSNKPWGTSSFMLPLVIHGVSIIWRTRLSQLWFVCRIGPLEVKAPDLSSGSDWGSTSDPCHGRQAFRQTNQRGRRPKFKMPSKFPRWRYLPNSLSERPLKALLGGECLGPLFTYLPRYYLEVARVYQPTYTRKKRKRNEKRRLSPGLLPRTTLRSAVPSISNPTTW